MEQGKRELLLTASVHTRTLWRNNIVYRFKNEPCGSKMTNEMILILLRGPLHTRGMADAFVKSHATLIRRLQIKITRSSTAMLNDGREKRSRAAWILESQTRGFGIRAYVDSITLSSKRVEITRAFRLTLQIFSTSDK